MSDFKELVKNLYTSKNRELTEDKLKYIETTYGGGKEEDFVKNFYTTVGEDLPEEKFNYIKDTYLKKKEPAISLGYKTTTELLKSGALPKQEKPSVLKTAGTTTPSVSIKRPSLEFTTEKPASTFAVDNKDLALTVGSREDRKQFLGQVRDGILGVVEKYPETYVSQKDKPTLYGEKKIPAGTPNVENISKAIDEYAEKIKRESGRELSVYDKEFVVKSVVESLGEKKTVGQAAARVDIDLVKEKKLPMYALTGIKTQKGEVVKESFFNEEIKNAALEKEKVLTNFQKTPNKKLDAEFAPELNTFKAEVKLESDILNNQIQSEYKQEFDAALAPLQQQYQSLVDSRQMTPEQANAEFKQKQQQISGEIQQNLNLKFKPEFDALNNKASLKTKEIQTRYNRKYQAEFDRLQEQQNEKIKAVQKKYEGVVSKEYFDEYSARLGQKIGEVKNENLQKELANFRNLSTKDKMEKALMAGWNDVLSTVGGAIGYTGLDASAINQAALQTGLFNPLPAAAFENMSLKDMLTDSDWWIINGVRSMPFTVVTMPIGIGGGVVAGSLARALGAAKRAQVISSVVGGGVIGWEAERFLESGSAFKEAIDAGKSVGEASEIASSSATLQFATLPLNIAQMLPFFGKGFKFLNSSLLEGFSGGIEEIIQGWAGQRAKNLQEGTEQNGFGEAVNSFGDYFFSKQAMQEGAIGFAVGQTMAVGSMLNTTPDTDKQIHTIMSSLAVGGEVQARKVLQLMKDNGAISDIEFTEYNNLIDYTLSGIASTETIPVSDDIKASLVNKYAGIFKARALMTEDENDLASQAAKELVAEKEKEIKEILKGTAPVYLIFPIGSDIPVVSTKEQVEQILLKNPNALDFFDIKSINDQVTQAKIDDAKGLLNKTKQAETTTDGKGRTKEAVSAGTDVLETGVGMAVEPGKERVAGEDIQAEKVLEPAKPSENISTAADSKGVYIKDGEYGFIRTEGQLVVFETNDKIIDLGNKDELAETPISEFGIEKEELLDVQVNEDNSVVVEGVKFVNNFSNPQAAINTDADGNVVSVNLETEDGKKRTIRGQRAEEIAYQYKLKEFEQNATEESIARLEQEVTRLEEEAKKPKPQTKKRSTAKRKPKEVVSEKVTEVTAPAIEVTPQAGSVGVGGEVELKENNDVEVEGRKAFDIFHKGKQVGTISLEDKGTHYEVSNAKVSTPNKGIGTEAYKQLISTLDKPLISDKILSQGADALWRKLEREGLAKYNEETKQFETVKETAKPAKTEAKKSKPEQIGEGLLDALGLAKEGEESTGSEFQDGVKPQFKVDLNENLSEDQADDVKKVFDEVLDNPNASTAEVINIDDTIDPSIPTQKITVPTTDNRPEAGLMSKLRIPLDFIFGKSVGLGMSDTLTTGERTVDVMNPETGKIEKKTIREEGGLGYPFKSLMDLINGVIPKGKKIFGWASVGEGAGTAMINAAKKANKITGLELKKLYFDNLNLTEEQKQRINDAIPDNKEYGLVSIYKMGNDGILSNEAHTREAFRQIETSLNESEKELFFKLAKERLASIKWEGKEEYINLINSANNFVELEDILHGKDSKLPLGSKASIIQNVFLSTEKTVSTETGNKLGELLKSKGISIESVSRAIEEPVMNGIDKGQPMLLLAIDPESKVIEDVKRERHKNYPYGVEGFPIGVFNETTQMHRISPEMMDNFVKTATTTVDENAKKDGKTVRVSIYQGANGSFYAQEGTGVKKLSIKDKKGNNLSGTSKEELLNKLKKEGYKISDATLKERYTQKINGTTFNNLLQKAKTGFISIFNNPKLSAQEKLVKYLQKAFPGISVEINLSEYKKLEDDFKAQKLFNKDGKSYGFVKDGRVYLNPEYLNNNTPIHEFGHVWNSFAKNYKPEIYAKGVELVNNSKYQSFVLNDAQYQKLIKAEFGADAIVKDKTTGKFIVNENSKNAKEIKDAVADEALAKAIGDKGELFVNEAQKRSFANWLNKLFDAIKQLAGFESMTPEQFQNLSLNQFVDAAVKEILSGNKVSDITSTELSKMTKTSAKFSLESQNDKIKNFIDAQRKAGQSDKDIKAGLELVADKVGLTTEDINNLMGVESDEAKPKKGYTPKKKKVEPAQEPEAEKTGTRAFAAKSVERAGVPIEDIPASLKNYRPTTVEEQQKIAEAFIRKHGIDNTITALRLPDSGIDPKSKPVLASVLLKELYAEQGNTKDVAEIEKIAIDVHNVLDAVLTSATEAAQFMAMMREFYNSNPYNYVAQVTRLIEKNINNPIKANVATAVVDINKANKDAAAKAASNVVNEVVTSKVTSAKEKFERSKANLKALWKKSFNIGIASNQYEAAKNDVQFAKALTIMAKDFVVYQSVQFGEFLKEVASQIGLNESDIDKDHLRKIFEKAKSERIQAGIKVGLKELELKLKDLIESHYSSTELEGKLIDKLKSELGIGSEFGLNDAAIKELENAIKREIKVLTAKEKIKALKVLGIKEQKDVNEILSLSEEGLLDDNSILETLGDKLGIKKLTPEEAAKLADLAKDINESKEDRIKARNIQKFEDYKFVLAKKYKIQDFLISNYLTNIFGSLTSNEKNIAGNVSETILLVGELMGNALASGNPKDIQRALKALVDGNIRGFDFTKEVLTTGVASYKEPGDIRARNMWELIMDRENDLTRIERNLQTLFRLPYLGPTLLAERRFWNRALLSMDSLSGTTNNELGSLLAATREADKQKLRGVKRTKFIEEQMANSAEAKEEARNYATSLGYKPGTGEFNRAVANYLVSKRPEAIKKAAAEYSARATLTQTPPPSTMTGAIANGLNDVISKNPNIKFFVPVVNTFANLIVKNIERSPFEFFSLAFDAGRAASGVESAKAGLTKAEVARRMKTAAVWTAISVLLFALAGGTDDDEEGFEVFGSGTGDPAVDNARRALGWKPNTVRFSKDGGYYNFEFLPFGFVLGMIGNMRDYFKYKNKPAFAIRQAQAKKIFGKNLDALDKNEREQLEAELAIPGKYNISAQEKKEFSNLLSELASTPVTYSFQLLKSLGELVNAVGEGAGAIKTALKSITNISRGLAAPRYLGEVRDIFDNKLYDTKEFRNVIGANVPFVKLGNVKLDAFGREIEKYKSESILSGIKYALTRGFYNPPTITPLDQFLWENGVGVSVPSNTPSMAYTEDVYREYIVTRGKILITNLTEALKNKEFEGLSPQEVLEVVNIYVTNANAEARDITDEKLDKLK